MHEKQFEFGPLSQGAYIALICVTAPVVMYFPQWWVHYLALLLFLGVGFRPFLTRTGLHGVYRQIENAVGGRWNRGYLEQRRAEVERKKRQQKFKNSRYRGQDKLPKNW